MKDSYRIDSLVLAVEQALAASPRRSFRARACRSGGRGDGARSEQRGLRAVLRNSSREFTGFLVRALELIGCPSARRFPLTPYPCWSCQSSLTPTLWSRSLPSFRTRAENGSTRVILATMRTTRALSSVYLPTLSSISMRFRFHTWSNKSRGCVKTPARCE